MAKINKLIRDITSWNDSPSRFGSSLRENNMSVLFPKDYVMPRPFKALPNVSEVKIRTNRLDPLLAVNGIARKLEPDMDFKQLSAKIKATNRYLWILQGRLEKLLRSNQVAYFWVLALMYLKRSKTLRMVALRKLNPNWHREMKLGQVKSILTRLNKSIWDLKTNLFIVRDYADKVKPDGSVTYRPIGAPSYPDRMYLYLLQCFVVMFIGAWLDKDQHGFMPGRGVVSASKALTDCLESSEFKYVWEFDLKGAFPSVSIPVACKAFKEIGFPPKFVDFIEQMSLETVERVDLAPVERKGLLPEPKFRKQELLGDALPIFLPGEYDWVESRLLMAGIEWFRARAAILKEIKDPIEKAHRAWAMHIIDNNERGDRGTPSPEQKAYLKALEHSQMTGTPLPLPKYTHEDFPALVEYRILVRERQKAEREKAAFLRERAASDRLTHGKMLAAKGESPIEVKGFPQGSGLSPILFNIAFEYAALRNHFLKLDPSVKVISYADDFVVFSKVPLPTIFEGSVEMNNMGLIINKEKSRPVKEDGSWVVKSMKFLGLTYHFEDDKIVLEGTPRSGSKLLFDKMDTVEAFELRDRELRKFCSELNLKASPQDALNAWGSGIRPYSLIPWEVMQGKRALTEGDLSSIKSILKGKDGKEVEIGGNTSSTWVQRQQRKLRTLFHSRISGLITNRLHGGSWTPEVEPADRSLKPGPGTKGESWIERIRNLKVRVPSLLRVSEKAMANVAARLEYYESRNRSLSIYNSTSYATRDIMSWQRDRKAMKLTRRGIIY